MPVDQDNTPDSNLIAILDRAGWLKKRVRPTESAMPALSAETCILQVLADLPHTTALGRSRLTKLVSQGWTLRPQFAQSPLFLESSLAGPLFFGHARHFANHRHYASLVTSRLGRNNKSLPDWDRWLDDFVRQVIQDQTTILTIQGTAAFEGFGHIIAAGGSQTLKVRIDDASSGVASWCVERFSDHSAESKTIYVSPGVILPELKCKRRDVLSVLLADDVYTPHVRPGGSIARLLTHRLRHKTPPNTLRIRNKATRTLVGTYATRPTHCSMLEDLLSNGAITWNPPSFKQDSGQPDYEAHRPRLGASVTSRCTIGVRSLQQIVAPVDALQEADDSKFLTHCTRASSSNHPMESDAAKRIRIWAEGNTATSPMDTLCKILDSGRLYASDRWNRTPSRLVSLSAVPLAELLSRRKFRSHLGRWDWEPFGIRVRKTSIQQAGARQVIYGDQARFAELAADQQPFFQVATSQSSGSTKTDWTLEKEWRHPGDLVFSRLPRQDVHVFVQTEAQAAAIARIYPWSVFWHRGG